MNTKLSIIIPLYNVEAYISRCLESVVSQSYENLEIIVIDDGSTDNSYEICQRYQKLDPRIKLYHQENRGVSAARNLGIQLSEGEYIWFVDGDDYIARNSVETILSKLDDCDMLVFDAIRVDNGEVKTMFHTPNDCYDVSTEEKFLYYLRDHFFVKQESGNYHGVNLWNKVYRRKLIIDNKLTCSDIAEIGSEDTELNLKYMCLCSRIKSMEGTFVYYIRNDNSITCTWTKSRKNLIFEFHRLAYRIYDFYNKNRFAILVINFYLIYMQILNLAVNRISVNGKTEWIGYTKKLKYPQFHHYHMRKSIFHPFVYMKYSYLSCWVKNLVIWGINYPVLSQGIIKLYDLRDREKKNGTGRKQSDTW